MSWWTARCAVAWLLLVVAGLSSAAECPLEPLPAAAPPFKAGDAPMPAPLDTYFGEDLRVPSDNVPVVVNVESRGSLLMSLGASKPISGIQPRLMLRAQIDVSSPGSTGFVQYCELGWAVLQQAFFGDRRVRLSGPDEQESRWRVRVYQRNETPQITVLDENLPRITFSGRQLQISRISFDPPLLPGRDPLRFVSTDPPPACSSTPVVPPADSEPLLQSQLSPGALNVPGMLYVTAGRNLYLRVGQGQSGKRVTVRIGVKPIAHGLAPLHVCTKTIAGPVRPEAWTRISRPWNWVTTESRWTIELVSASPSPPLSIELRRDRRSESERTIVKPHGPDVFTCIPFDEKARLEPGFDGTGSRFQAVYALSVDTGLKGLVVSKEASDQVVDALLNAVLLWRGACTRCTPYQFAVVSVDDAVYVPTNMLQGTPENFRATFASGYPWTSRLGGTGKNQGFVANALPFVRIEHTARQRSRFCVQRDETEHKFSAAQSPLCRPTKATNEGEMKIRIQWDKNPRPCGNIEDAVACWNGAGVIRMNVRDFSFYVGNVGDVIIGTSARQADLVRVFAHEVGHWLGLPHLSAAGSIMSHEFSAARCLDKASQTRINAIADRSVLPEYKSEALIYGK